MTDLTPTDEQIEAAARAIRDMPFDGSEAARPRVWEKMSDAAKEVYLETARVALTAAVPLIAADVLRATALVVRDDDEQFAHGELCRYGPPGTCDCERGEFCRWLIARAEGMAS